MLSYMRKFMTSRTEQVVERLVYPAVKIVCDESIKFDSNTMH